MAVKSSKLTTILLLLIILAYLVYSAHYIYQTSHVIDGKRYFNLNDDAMISMRYARNLANGNGLVWNPGGDRVEGFTNPLWVMYMAIFHLMPIPIELISLPIQITGAILMVVNILLVFKITQQFTDKAVVILGAVVLTGFYGPLNNWSLLGMEVSLLTVLVSWAVLKAMQSLDDETFNLAPYLILGVGTYVRIDMAVPYVVVMAVLSYYDRVNLRKHIVWGVGLLAAFLLSQTGLRLWYYGYLLPNTYYLKVLGTPLTVRIGKGLYALFNLIWKANWLIALLPFTLLTFRRDRKIILMFLVFLAQVAYSVYVGGDAWEHMGGANRYISQGISFFFILLSLAVGTLFEVLILSLNTGAKISRWVYQLGTAVFLLICLVNVNIRIEANSLRKWLAIAPPEFSVASEYYIEIAHAVEKISTREASIAVQAAGTIPYFTDRYTVDLYGKNDLVIARQDSHLKPGWAGIKEFRPGHTKWDAMYSVVELQPDLLLQLSKDPDQTSAEALAFVEEHYVIVEVDGYSFTALKNSPFILWDQVELLE